MSGFQHSTVPSACTAWLLLALSACTQDSDPGPTRDAGGNLDAGALADAGSDARSGEDAGSDAGAVPDADIDSGPDADTDAGLDAQVGDAGDGPDAGPGPDAATDPWQGCPAAADYVGPSAGAHEIVATADAVYCALFDENRTLKEELAAKAMLRIAPGRYALDAKDHASFALPMCLRAASPPHPSVGSPGTLGYTSSSFEGVTTHSYAWQQPVTASGQSLTLAARFDLIASGAAVPPFTLDGNHPPPGDGGETFGLALCEDPESCWPARLFDSCHFRGSQAHVHEVELNQGTLRLELNIGDSFASTEPGAFVRASGTFRGQAFDQRDYWKLIYNPEHHHFTRDFAVLFDAPIEGVCGIEIAHLEPLEDNLVADEAFAVDCQLEHLSTLSVTKHTHTRPPAP
jgi:hypothetical protein